jgi:CheY-like chemotaxis protein
MRASREVFALLLRKEGYEVAAAENGFDGLLKLKQLVPDVIISDLNMPKMSGFEFLSVVRRRFPKISVIASSGAYEAESSRPGCLPTLFTLRGRILWKLS